MIQVIETKDCRAMDKFSSVELDLLDKTIKTVDPSVAIDTVDYDKGIVQVSITYNLNTPNQWTNHNFMQINVACESVAAAFHEVYEHVYQRCI